MAALAVGCCSYENNCSVIIASMFCKCIKDEKEPVIQIFIFVKPITLTVFHLSLLAEKKGSGNVLCCAHFLLPTR